MIPSAIADSVEFSHLRSIVLIRGVPFAFERSARFREGELSDQRGLFSIPLAAANDHLPESMISLCQCWNAPPEVLRAVTLYYGRAHHIHFGLDIQPTLVTAKCYLETDADLQFLGFKWTRGSARPSILSRYRRLAGVSADDLQNRIRNLIPDYQRTDVMSILQEVVGRQADLNVLEISDESTDRHSYDINCYDFEMTLGDLEQPVDSILTSFGIAKAERRRWLSEVSQHTLGHIAIGVDRDQQPFVTIYHKPDN